MITYLKYTVYELFLTGILEKTDVPLSFLVSLCSCLLTNHKLPCAVYVT